MKKQRRSALLCTVHAYTQQTECFSEIKHFILTISSQLIQDHSYQPQINTSYYSNHYSEKELNTQNLSSYNKQHLTVFKMSHFNPKTSIWFKGQMKDLKTMFLATGNCFP